MQSCHSGRIPKVDIDFTVGESSKEQLSSLSLSLELLLQDGVKEEAVVGIGTLLVQLLAKHLQGCHIHSGVGGTKYGEYYCENLIIPLHNEPP